MGATTSTRAVSLPGGSASASVASRDPRTAALIDQLRQLSARAGQLGAALAPQEVQELAALVNRAVQTGTLDTSLAARIIAPAAARKQGAPQAYISALRGAEELITTRLDAQDVLAAQRGSSTAAAGTDAALAKMTKITRQYQSDVHATIASSGTDPAGAIAAIEALTKQLRGD